jgi:pimeloyl-ACP methyl ester carboxylesterase
MRVSLSITMLAATAAIACSGAGRHSADAGISPDADVDLIPDAGPQRETLPEFCGKPVSVTAAEGRPKLAGAVRLRRTDDGSPADLVIDDPRLMRLVEMGTRHVLGAMLEVQDVSSLDLPAVCFKNAVVDRQGNEARLATAEVLEGGEGKPMRADVPVQAFLDALYPSCPSEDALHHSIELPVSYAKPALGTFRLYYELSTGFDPSKKTFFIMNDPQSAGSMLGFADRFVREGWTPKGTNAIAFEVRGNPCSPIDVHAADGSIDWEKAFEAFNMDNMIEDIERIRHAVLGDGQLLMAGESGHAFTAMQYMAKYPTNVEKALLVSFGRNPEASATAGRAFARSFFIENGLLGALEQLIAAGTVSRGQLMYIIQREFYQHPELIIEMIQNLQAGDPTLYEQLCRAEGDVEFEIANYLHHNPNLIVYFFHLGMRPVDDPLDVFYRESQMVMPLVALAAWGRIPSVPAAPQSLGAIQTKTLLAAGTLDQVVPIEETRAIRAELPGSQLLVFRDAHSLMNEPECVMALRQNLDAPAAEIDAILHSEQCARFDHVE